MDGNHNTLAVVEDSKQMSSAWPQFHATFNQICQYLSWKTAEIRPAWSLATTGVTNDTQTLTNPSPWDSSQIDDVGNQLQIATNPFLFSTLNSAIDKLLEIAHATETRHLVLLIASLSSVSCDAEESVLQTISMRLRENNILFHVIIGRMQVVIFQAANQLIELSRRANPLTLADHPWLEAKYSFSKPLQIWLGSNLMDSSIITNATTAGKRGQVHLQNPYPILNTWKDPPAPRLRPILPKVETGVSDEGLSRFATASAQAPMDVPLSPYSTTSGCRSTAYTTRIPSTLPSTSESESDDMSKTCIAPSDLSPPSPPSPRHQHNPLAKLNWFKAESWAILAAAVAEASLRQPSGMMESSQRNDIPGFTGIFGTRVPHNHPTLVEWRETCQNCTSNAPGICPHHQSPSPGEYPPSTSTSAVDAMGWLPESHHPLNTYQHLTAASTFSGNLINQISPKTASTYQAVASPEEHYSPHLHPPVASSHMHHMSLSAPSTTLYSSTEILDSVPPAIWSSRSTIQPHQFSTESSLSGWDTLPT